MIFENCGEIDTGICSNPSEIYEEGISGLVETVEGIMNRGDRGLCGIKINDTNFGCSGTGYIKTGSLEVNGVLVGMKWYSDEYMKFWQPVYVTV